MQKFREDSISEKTKSNEIWFIKKSLRVNIELYVLYLEKNRFRRWAIHRRMQNLNYVNKLFFAKTSSGKEFLKNISGYILNFKCFYLKGNWPRRNATQSRELM